MLQRLYAFLLRRLLEPLLDDASLAKLHHSIEVSLPNGTISLCHVRIKAQAINDQLEPNPIQVRSAIIERLDIRFSLVEADPSLGGRSSWTWRAMQVLQATKAQALVQLLCDIEMDGVCIEVEVNDSATGRDTEGLGDTHARETDAKTVADRDGYMAQYLDAILASLRWRVQLSNLSLRYLANGGDRREVWLELLVKRFVYHDRMDHASRVPTDATKRNIIHKVLEVKQLSLAVGETEFLVAEPLDTSADGDSESTVMRHETRIPLALCEEAQGQLRAVGIYGSEQTLSQVDNDLQLRLSQRLHISLSSKLLELAHPLVEPLAQYKRRRRANAGDGIPLLGSQTAPDDTISPCEELEDENSILYLRRFAQQYEDARMLLAQNYYRGGLLLPTDGEVDEEDAQFDMFFDANESGFGHYSSILMGSSVGPGDAVKSGRPLATFRLKLAVSQGSLKLLYETSEKRRDEAPGYLLVSFSELNATAYLDNGTADYNLSIEHADAEAAVRSVPGEEAINIVQIWRCMSLYAEHVINAPCLSLACKVEEHSQTCLDMVLEPIEFTFCQVSMRELSRFLQVANGIFACWNGENEHDALTSETQAPKVDRIVSVCVSCPSIIILVPLFCNEDFSTLFRRCGYPSSLWGSSRHALGLQIHQTTLVLQTTAEEPIFCFSTGLINIFASAPRLYLNSGTPRFDLFSIIGYGDDDAISMKAWKAFDDRDRQYSRCKKAFPTVPAVCSFKARQQDDDEDSRVDRILFSDIEGMNVATRRDLRATDPQTRMIEAAGESDYLVEIQVSECSGDVTTAELSTFLSMIDFVPRNLSNMSRHADEVEQTSEGDTSISVKLDCDFISIVLHRMAEDESLNFGHHASFIANGSNLKLHLLNFQNSLHNMRFLLDELDLFIATSDSNSPPPKELRSQSPAERLRFFAKCSHAPVVEPVVHRSHLFQPISRQSPALVLDVINSTFGGVSEQVSIHMTVYDTTVRLNPDSECIQQLNEILQQLKASRARNQREFSESHSLTRVFFSFADCNIDYSPSAKFELSSRMIIRIGDFRVSSNIVRPRPLKEAFSIALGDGVIFLFKESYPYDYENSKIPRSALYMQQKETDPCFSGNDQMTSPMDVMELMDYVTIATLDSLDGVVAIACSDSQLRSDATVQTSVTAGEICFYACKDSFSKFISTVSELSTELAAIDEAGLTAMSDFSFPLQEESTTAEQTCISQSFSPKLCISPGEDAQESSVVDEMLLLDGYEWTTVDQDKDGLSMHLGDEQSARWYHDVGCENSHSSINTNVVQPLHSSHLLGPSVEKSPCIVPDHFSLPAVSDSLQDAADFGIEKLVGPTVIPTIGSRVIVHDLKMSFRLFDGYDWPDMLDASLSCSGSKGAFVIDNNTVSNTDGEPEAMQLASGFQTNSTDKKADLLSDLLVGEPPRASGVFHNVPLPDEKAAMLKEQLQRRRLSRRAAKYFQFVASGLSFKFDSFVKAKDHKLSSFLNMKVQDFFAAETISSDRPVKMAGEWISDQEHPRETTEGLLSMKLVTWHPPVRVRSGRVLVGDDCEALIKVLPLRCILDQRAIRFVRIFTQQPGENQDKQSTPSDGRYWLPPPAFKLLRFKPFKLKVDYRPEKIDTDALRNGAIVELVNLTPIDSMVLTLKQVDLSDVDGFGSVLSAVTRQWIDDVCSTQLLKFLTNARPLEPLKTVSQGAGDLIVLPWEAIQNGEDVKRALRAGVKSFSKAVVYEAFTVTSRTAEFIAEQISKLSTSATGSSTLPLRPLKAPRGVVDTTPHVVESLTRGFQAANYKIIVVPYREYRRNGAKGAVTSVLRGIPVAIAAPASGAVEAISYGMLGARNQLAPEVRKEEEATQRGLYWQG